MDGDVELTLPPDPRAAGDARRAVAAALRRWRLDELVDPAVLLVSELVTNAVGHGRSEVVLRAARRGWLVRLEVQDEDSRLPVPQAAPLDALGGRGLTLVEALSDRWGAAPCRSGKVVWAELAADAAAPVS